MVRHEQHFRPLGEYPEEDDSFDGARVQWFDSMDAYSASLDELDFAAVVMENVPQFLDGDRLHFVVTEEPLVVTPGPPR